MKKQIHHCLPFALSLVATLFTGCASIIDGGDTKVVNIQSQPSGAAIKITDERSGQVVYTGVTPTSVSLGRSTGFFKGARYTVEYSLDGYSTKSMQITSELNGWYIGNLLFGGLIGMLIVDPATGAMYTLPKAAYVDLDPLVSQIEESDTPTLAVISLSDLPEELVGDLVRIN